MPIRPDAGKLIDAYIASMPEFARPICKQLRTLIHKADPEIIEDWKWGPNFNKQGMLCGFGAFKAHVTFTFFKGSQLKDPKRMLEPCSAGNANNRSIKFQNAGEIPEAALIALVKEAVRLNAQGVKRRPVRAALPMPKDLVAALKKNAKAAKYFEALSPSCKREYIEWILQAKRPETRTERIARTVKQCGAGRSLNYKYK